MSRRFQIVDHAANGARGFYSLIGGKLASFRVQAAEMADAVCDRLGVPVRCETHFHKLPGGDHLPDEHELARAYGVGRLAVRRLIARHGSLAVQVLDVGRETPTGMQPVCTSEPTLECEVRYCIRHEHVRRLGDLMIRCRIGMAACQGLRCGLRAAQIFASERALHPDDERNALMDLLSRRWRSARPVLTGAQLAQAELLMGEYTGVWRQPRLAPVT